MYPSTFISPEAPEEIPAAGKPIHNAEFDESAAFPFPVDVKLTQPPSARAPSAVNSGFGAPVSSAISFESLGIYIPHIGKYLITISELATGVNVVVKVVPETV